jgi:riboflavin synthase
MFSGIIERVGKIRKLSATGTNIDFEIESELVPELYIDQSISHNGVCLTVTSIGQDSYMVTAVKETLNKTNLGSLKQEDSINLERSLKAGSRMDGHFVQGHIDSVADCTEISDMDGSWLFTFHTDEKHRNLIVDKGSVCINGVSLTVVNPVGSTFSVAIIPYTYEHTTFKNLKKGDVVNIEFDVLGKYIIRYLDQLNIKL